MHVSYPGPPQRRRRRGRAAPRLCGAVLIGAAALRLLWPGAVGTLRRFAFGEAEQTGGYVEVFSALGEALTRRDGLSEAFGRISTALLGEDGVETAEAAAVPESTPAQAPAGIAVRLSQPGESAGQAVRRRAELLRAAGASAATEDAAATVAEEAVTAMAPATLEYDYPELEPPEGVRLDYVPLPAALDYVLPVAGEVSSTFGYRLHPLEGEVLFHNGLDLAAAEGTEVLCFADGVIRAAGEHPNLGKYYIVTHADGVETLYGHLRDWLLPEGSSVGKGQAIGTVGQSGAATGPHLHLELFVDGVRVNPLYYLSP